jgi:hypothetical protein
MTEITSSTVNEAMDWTVYEVVRGAVHRAVPMDWYRASAAAHGGHPNHPALSDFLLEVDSGFR